MAYAKILILPRLICIVILHSDWLRQYQPRFHTVQNQVFMHGLVFHFEMAEIMMKIQQDKIVIIFLIVDILGNLNIQIHAGFFLAIPLV